jgi:hypothetical protein
MFIMVTLCIYQIHLHDKNTCKNTRPTRSVNHLIMYVNWAIQSFLNGTFEWDESRCPICKFAFQKMDSQYIIMFYYWHVKCQLPLIKHEYVNMHFKCFHESCYYIYKIILSSNALHGTGSKHKSTFIHLNVEILIKYTYLGRLSLHLHSDTFISLHVKQRLAPSFI